MSNKPYYDSPKTSEATAATKTPTISPTKPDLSENTLLMEAGNYEKTLSSFSPRLMRSLEPEFSAYVECPVQAGEIWAQPPLRSPLVLPNYYASSSRRNRYCSREKKPSFCSGGVRSHPKVFNPNQNATLINNGGMSLVGKNLKLVELRTSNIEVMYDDMPQRNSRTFFSDDDDDDSDDDDEKQGSTAAWDLQSPRASDYHLFPIYSKI